MASFRFELISPQQVLFDGEVQSIMLPGAEGDMTVLPGHSRMVTMVNPGMIEAIDADGNGFRIFVSRALAEIIEDAVTLLAEVAVMEEELSQMHIDEEIVRLETEIAASTDETVRTIGRSLILRLQQIKVSYTR